MIFTLRDGVSPLELKQIPGVHLYCFFSVPHSLNCPSSLWFEAISASLRMKKEVLILEAEIREFPHWNSKARWDVGEHWLWLAPRALGPLTDTYQLEFQDLNSLKALLKSRK